MNQYGLNGIIHNVKLCPTFTDQLGRPQITGECQVVSCDQDTKGVLKCISWPDLEKPTR